MSNINLPAIDTSSSASVRVVLQFLCVCRAGRVRSQTLAACLNERGHQAVACGIKYARTIRTVGMFVDIVIVVDYPPDLLQRVRDTTAAPVIRWDIGKDLWLKPGHPELMVLARKFCDEQGW